MLDILLLLLSFFYVCFADEKEVKFKFISNLVEVPGEGVASFNGSVNEKFHDYMAENGRGKIFLLVEKIDNKFVISKQPDAICIKLDDMRNNLIGDKTECKLDVKKCIIKISTTVCWVPVTMDGELVTRINKSNYKYVVNLNNICCIIFKLVSANGDIKYLLTTPDFYNYFENDNKATAMFEGTNYKEISIEHVFGDINEWTDFSYIFKNCKTVEKISIKKCKYNFESANNAFSGCENLTTIDGYRNIFSNTLESCKMMFEGCSSLKSIDISGIKMPTRCNKMFLSSGIKSINMKNTDFKNVIDCNGIFYNSEIENIDFSNVKNLKPIIFQNMFLDCHNLKDLNLNGIDFSELDRFNSNFGNTPNLKNIDLCMCKFNSATVLRELDKEIILPNDPKSAHVYLKELQKSITDEDDMETDSSGKVIYKNVELNNLNKYDNLNAFITNPKEYLNNRQGIIDRNRKISKIPQTRNITPSSGPCCGCCLKCCSNCCGNACGC